MPPRPPGSGSGSAYRLVMALSLSLPLLPAAPEPRQGSAHRPAFSNRPDTARTATWRWIATAAADEKPQSGTVRYTCPMHPHYIADHPGSCPICGMDLVKAAAADAPGETAAGNERQIVVVRPEVLQNMGVRIAAAEQANFGRTVRAAGLVMENERMRSVVTARVEGWVEDLRITALGDPVKKGMKLFELYAPELVVSQRDYLAALRLRDDVRLATTEARLRSFGVQDEVMARLRREGQEVQRVPFYADRDGIVAELPMARGDYVRRGSTILRIQDYASVWLTASIAEKDLASLKTGQPASATLAGLADRPVEARIDYIYPAVDPKTRTGRVRLVLENEGGDIRPGSFADVTFEVGAMARLAVPSEAVLRDESGPYVVMSLGEGRFQPRAIRTGVVKGQWTEVLNGLGAGEKVVVSGQFLIDSESALRESFRKLERTQMPLSLLALDPTQLAMVDHMVDAALYLHEALVDGYAIEPRFLDPARDVAGALAPRLGDTRLAFVLDDAAKAIAEAQAARSDSETRAALVALVRALQPWMSEGRPAHYIEKKVMLVKDRSSGWPWLQRSGPLSNPYGKGAGEAVSWPAPAQTAATAAPASLPRSEAATPAHDHKTTR